MAEAKAAPVDEMVQERVMLSSLQARIPPKQITVLPNGEQALFLGPNYKHKNNHLSLQIINLFDNEKNQWGQAFDFSAVANLSTELSLEQKLLRERTRTSAHGITSYSFHKQTNQVLFQYGPHLLLSQIPTQKITQFNSIPVIKIGNQSYDNIGTRMDSNLTTDGSWIVFTRNDDLWVTTSRPNYVSKLNQNAAEIRLTFAQNISKDTTAGVADFINQEEFDRFTGYWLSPNYNDFVLNDVAYREYSILYLEADNSNVPTITIPSMDGIEQHKWPRAGETNCSFKVKMVTFSVPMACCANINNDNDDLINFENVSKSNIIINDHELQQSIYSSFSWIEYIVRAGWTARKGECWVQYLDRKQMRTNVVLYKSDKHFVRCRGGAGNDENKTQEAAADENVLCGDELLHLYGTPWINITDTYSFMAKGLIWCSEHTGYKHLYFIAYPSKENEQIDGIDYKFGIDQSDEKFDATQVNMTFLTPHSCNVQVLTSGKWEVEGEAIWFDEKTNTVYFQGRRETHLESHLYSVQFDPLKAPMSAYQINKLTKDGYFHSPNVDSINFKFFSSIYSSISSTRHFAIYSIDGQCIKEFDIPHRGAPNKLKYASPQIVNIDNFPATATEQDKLDEDYKNLYTFSAVIYPPYLYALDMDAEKREGGYPTIIYVYGGPHAQLVINSWDRVTGNARCQLWRSLGYTVAIMDGRGSNHRGLAFEGRVKYKMGQIEIEDQVKLVQCLVASGWTDPSKVGITGYSYGGYLSLMALCQRPDIFTCCIAGAPVTLWQLYDTGYTERYMGTPQENKHGYEHGSVLKYVKHFPNEEGRVVIIHGLGDENVHFYHTSKLINAMVKVGKPYELKIFPGERHGIRQWDNVIYMEKYYISHFDKFLK